MKRVLLSSIAFFLKSVVDAYCPVAICPGFGNDSIDYDKPFEQPREVGMKSVLTRRGFDPEKIYTVPVKRSDWLRVAGGLFDIPKFYTGDALPTGLGYGWYLKRVKETVDLAYKETGERVMLIGHSAGGWLARAAMGDGVWCDDGGGIRTSDRVRCLVSLGAIHRTPNDPSTCVTRGALKNTDRAFPGAYLKREDIKYFSVGGTAVIGDNNPIDDGNPKTHVSKVAYNVSKFAYNSYEAVCGNGNTVGDGIVPFDWTQLEGSKKIQLDGVFHSIHKAVTTSIPTDRWYGSEKVVDRWLDTVLEELDISDKGRSSENNSFAFSNEKNICKRNKTFSLDFH